jgi:hypothetical protein
MPPLPPPPHQTEVVKKIMAKVVSKQSTDNYAGQNSMFAIFCYKSAELREHLLEPWFIQHLDEHQTETLKKKICKEFLLDHESRGQ